MKICNICRCLILLGLILAGTACSDSSHSNTEISELNSFTIDVTQEEASEAKEEETDMFYEETEAHLKRLVCENLKVASLDDISIDMWASVVSFSVFCHPNGHTYEIVVTCETEDERYTNSVELEEYGNYGEQRVPRMDFLKNFTGLKTLYISGDYTADSIASISQCETLEVLYLSNTKGLDHSPLRQLPNLKEIHIDKLDESALAGLPNRPDQFIYVGLNSVFVSNPKIFNEVNNFVTLSLALPEKSEVDLTPIANLSKIETLSMHGGEFTNYAALGELQALKELDIWALSHPDLSFLEHLPQLKKLTLHTYGEKQASISLGSAASAPGVEELYIQNANIGSLRGITGFTNLARLVITDSRLTDLAGVSALKNLQDLDISDTEVDSLEELTGLRKLTKISVQRGKVQSLEPLREMEQLEYLLVTGNQITTLEPLRNLKRLTFLGVGANRISSVEPLAGLPQLEELDVYDNQLASLNTLATMPNLRYISAEVNQIEDVNAFTGNAVLTHFYLDGNPLEINALGNMLMTLPSLQFYTAPDEILDFISATNGGIKARRGQEEMIPSPRPNPHLDE